ncbi:MAG: hypothetical protein QOG83_536 [Alphaproteobacteria bacterium]|nr:hypothetical protein [Alphaproteobacteria bacterium]
MSAPVAVGHHHCRLVALVITMIITGVRLVIAMVCSVWAGTRAPSDAAASAGALP